MRKAALMILLSVPAMQPAHAHDEATDAIPSYYTVKNHCVAGRGFVAVPEAPGFPPAYPFVALLVFKGEIVGFLLEVGEKDGWKPWYNQPQEQPVSHDGGPRHYTQTIMIKKGPTAEECKAAKR